MSISRRQFAGLALSAMLVATTGVSSALAGEKRTGSFTGKNGYTAKGGVTITKNAKGQTIIALDNKYKFVGDPPDIKLAFGNKKSDAKRNLVHSKLTHKSGAATFVVPKGADANLGNLYIYCERYNVILGSAKLN